MSRLPIIIMMFMLASAAHAGGYNSQYSGQQSDYHAPYGDYQDRSSIYQDPHGAYQDPASVYQDPHGAYQDPASVYQDPSSNVYIPRNR